MTSFIDQTGLNIESNPAIVTDLITAFQAIYGSDINVDSNSPDGQLIRIFAQSVTDMLELLLATYNLSAVPTAYGTRLDQLVALNGLVRQQGTYTLAIVALTISVPQTVPGLDQTAVPPFTVADNSGNQFQLVTSLVAVSPGIAAVQFRAVTIGQVQTIPNTITTIITSTLGVNSANNPTVAGDSIGVNEETDSQLKVRHAQSFNLAATGPADSIEAALRNISGVVDAYVVENTTGGSVGGVPAHSIWTIVRGGTSADIGQAIYSKKGLGSGMKGSTTQIITRPNGATFTAQWDVAIAENLFIKFSVIWRGAQVLANADIETALATALVYKLGQNPNIGDVVTAMAVIAPTAIVTINSALQGVSVDNATWASLVTPSDAQHYFTVSSANIVVT